ncbi:MAG: RNA methyltransferase [Bacteroidota bacterium]
MNLPSAFQQRMQQQLPEEYHDFLAALQQTTPTSIHLNPKKPMVIDHLKEGVKWFKRGYYLGERPSFTFDPLFHAGCYYVQEASSMFVAEMIRQIKGRLNKKRVLDLCAAPGGKSTLLLSTLGDTTLLVANEVIKSRINSLKENLYRWGDYNLLISNHDAKDYSPLDNFFDILITDVPCSGEGLFRKQPKSITEWSIANAQICASRQRRILADVSHLLKPGGFLIYSTCTYNPAENEEQVLWLQQEFGLQPFPLSIPETWNIKQLDYGYQFYPHHIQGEGFYACCLQKPGTTPEESPDRFSLPPKFRSLPRKQREQVQTWLKPGAYQWLLHDSGKIFVVDECWAADLATLRRALPQSSFGLYVGEFKGKDFIPSHQLALSTAINTELAAVELDKEQAIAYLRKDPIQQLTSSPTKGWQLARYQGHNLGWMKVLKNRINNYLPKEWRIRKQI